MSRRLGEVCSVGVGRWEGGKEEEEEKMVEGEGE